MNLTDPHVIAANLAELRAERRSTDWPLALGLLCLPSFVCLVIIGLRLALHR